MNCAKGRLHIQLFWQTRAGVSLWQGEEESSWGQERGYSQGRRCGKSLRLACHKQEAPNNCLCWSPCGSRPQFLHASASCQSGDEGVSPPDAGGAVHVDVSITEGVKWHMHVSLDWK